MKKSTLEEFVGNTPLVAIDRINPNKKNIILVKLEGNNPAGSIKDRPVYNMVKSAELRGEISPGDRLIEATSGNTGIALAMVAAMKGYSMTLIMPENATQERKSAMTAYGAELILVSKQEGMEGARDLASQMEKEGKGRVLNQFANADNYLAHYQSTGPEIWRDTEGKVSHFISAMGTTGTIMGCSRYLKEKNNNIQIIGLQPDGSSSIPGIRRWPNEYLPPIFDRNRVDQIIDVSEEDALAVTRELAAQEGICSGVSTGGNVWAAVELSKKLDNAVIVTVSCDRGDRYLSTGIFDL